MATDVFANESPAGRPKILITGRSGRIGTRLTAELAGKFDFLDWGPTLRESTEFAGVLHMAANPDMSQPWDEVVKNGITPMFAVLEGARRLGVPRFVYTSSCHVVDMRPGIRGEMIPSGVAPDPATPYALGKACCEALAAFYSRTHGLAVDILRVGWVVNVEKAAIYYPSVLMYYCDISDFIRLVSRIFQSKRSGLHCYYAMSKGTTLRWEMANSLADLGFRPRCHTLLKTGPFVLRDVLRRAPGIFYRGLAASFRNLVFGRPVVAEKTQPTGDVSYELRGPSCDHPSASVFLESLDGFFRFLERERNKRVVIVVAPAPEGQSEGAKATKELFDAMAGLVVKYFRSQGMDVEMECKNDRP